MANSLLIIPESLSAYIVSALASGCTQVQITEMLRISGWDPKLVEYALQHNRSQKPVKIPFAIEIIVCLLTAGIAGYLAFAVHSYAVVHERSSTTLK